MSYLEVMFKLFYVLYGVGDLFIVLYFGYYLWIGKNWNVLVCIVVMFYEILKVSLDKSCIELDLVEF